MAIAQQAGKRDRGEGNAAFPRERVLVWAAQLVAALAHVHERHILHRDLKSSNVYLARNKDIKLGDFGLSRTFGSNSHLASTVCGTPYYLSPEQVRWRSAEPRGPSLGQGAVAWPPSGLPPRSILAADFVSPG